ncbi:MAG: acyl-CoA dehydrogenase [Polyangiaceae bacterium UTPRO1]|jgi:alkylation response protein AidB-like acyl-CoA dehydrogenase|nr:acyl-CoA dehydrogenase family protein [Myxococcales bacterium]OQY66166.1 MAG: acyl-CoA dehydrogenase [Polyangiaceae bacterium UTPRO1]
MDARFSAADEAFRDEVRTWLEENLVGEFAELRGRGGSGDLAGAVELRRAWERRLAAGGWTCVGWPQAFGGRGLELSQEVIFNEEYARARAPGRLGHIGETLLGPTLIAFGTAEQQRRFLPPIVRTDELWCQGYSEPNAGSDLGNVQCRAERDGEQWVVTGQKVWTSLATISDWCFVLCRTDPTAAKHRGISYLLVPMQQPGVEVRPIRQITGTAEFCEVFFDGARTDVANVVGAVHGGWQVAMGTLAFERGASTLGQQMMFAGELDQVIAAAKANGAAKDPVIRQRLADAWIGLKIMRYNALRILTAAAGGAALSREALVTKLYWATWHRDLGKLAMDVLGARGEIRTSGAIDDYEIDELQRLFLWTRADTIYAGTNQIQRNIIAERALGMPREPGAAGKG